MLCLCELFGAFAKLRTATVSFFMSGRSVHMKELVWVDPRAGLDKCEKTPLPGFNPRTVQPVASRCTDWAILAAIIKEPLNLWLLHLTKLDHKNFQNCVGLVYLKVLWRVSAKTVYGSKTTGAWSWVQKFILAEALSSSVRIGVKRSDAVTSPALPFSQRHSPLSSVQLQFAHTTTVPHSVCTVPPQYHVYTVITFKSPLFAFVSNF